MTVLLRSLPLLLLAMASLCAWAQPPVEASYLTVSVVDPEGRPVTEEVALACYLGQQDDKQPEGTLLTAEGHTLILGNLTPGPHELYLRLPAHGLIDGPRSLEILPGGNHYQWQLPRLVPVVGAFTREGHPVTPTQVTGYLRTLPVRAPRPVPVPLADGGYRLAGLFPGDYWLLVLSDLGYAVAPLGIAPQATPPARLDLPLLPGGALQLTFRDRAGQPIPQVNVTLRSTVAAEFVPVISRTADAAGTLLATQLPPGDWFVYAYADGYRPSGHVRLTVSAGVTTQQTVMLEPAQ